MGITHGRSFSDVKVQKSIDGLPYTNTLSITGYIANLTTNWQLVSPNANVAALPHGLQRVADYVFVASTNAGDNITGTGARVLIMTGVDENYNEYQEILLLNGQTPVRTAQKIIPFELLIIQFGSNVDTNGDSVALGTIYCGTGIFTAGVPSIPLIAIESSSADPNSRDAIFVVPDGKLLLWKSLFVTGEPDRIENTTAIVQLAFRLFGFGDNQWFKTLPYSFNGIYNVIPENVIPLPPRTQVQIRCKAGSIKTRAISIQADFELKELR